MVFGLFKKAAGDFANRYGGNKDFLEAVCSASAIVAAADGDISDDEISACIEMCRNNDNLKAAYTQSAIEECMEKQIKRAKTASGRIGLSRELDDVAAKDIQLREDVFLAALDVAAADGDIGVKETAALAKVASRLGVDANKLMS
jgi:tellurite resistance protein TerB